MGIINTTWNPNDMNGNMSLSNGNLTIISALAAASGGNIRATHGKSTGKWYWELRLDAGGTTLYAGIASGDYPITNGEYMGTSTDILKTRAYYGNNGNKLPEYTSYGTPIAVGDIIGVALDLDNGTLEFYKNGVSMGISHTNVKELGEVYPMHKSMGTASRTITANFGASPFAYNIPVNFKSYDGSQSNAHKILISSEEEYYSVIPELIRTETAIPQMTSNTTPSGRAFASSVYSATYDVWKAFDQIDNNYFISVTRSGGVGYLGYEFVNPIRVGKYIVRNISSSDSNLRAMPKDWTFEGSNDGANWTVLDTQVNQTWTSANTDKEYFIDINRVNIYKIYRLNWSANNGNTNVSILGELKMYEYTSPTLLSLPNQSEQTFINYGMNKDTSIHLTTSKVLERRYMVQDNIELGSGKVFKQKIDTTRIPIRNAVIE